MGNARIDSLLNSTLAGKITQGLADKKENQKESIKANIWNDFVQKIGVGKTIQNEISLENAINSITKYAVVEAHKHDKSANDVAKEWLDIVGLEISSKETVPDNSKAPAETNTVIHYNSDNTIDYEEEFLSGTNIVIRETDYVDNKPSFTNIRNNKGQWIEQIGYSSDSKKEYVNKYNPQKSGEILSVTHYNDDGETIDNVEEFWPGTDVVKNQTDYVDNKPSFTNVRNSQNQWIRQINYEEDGSYVVKELNPANPDPCQPLSEQRYSAKDSALIEGLKTNVE